MRRLARRAAVMAAFAILASTQAAVHAAAGPPPVKAARLRQVHDWAFAIGEHALEGDAVGRLSRFDMVVVDGEAASKALVRALRRRGTLVLAYLSVGTIERGRWWYGRALPYRLDYWGDWGEWYADVARPGYRTIIATKVAPWILAKGFDGLFLDNTDMIESHTTQTAGMRSLVRALARRVRVRGRVLVTQNGEDSIGPLVRYYDGWNREDVTWTYDFERKRYAPVPRAAGRAARAALARMRRAGLLTMATDYTRSGDRRAERLCVRNARAAGALPYVSDIGLGRMPRTPYR